MINRRTYQQVKSRGNGEIYTRVPFYDFMATLNAYKRRAQLSLLVFKLPMEFIFDNGRICNEWDCLEVSGRHLKATSDKYGDIYYGLEYGGYILQHGDDKAPLGEFKEVLIFHDDFQALIDKL